MSTESAPSPAPGTTAAAAASPATMLLIGMGDHTLTLALTAMSVLHVFFLTEYVGLRPALAGTVPLIGRIVDALTDPLMGRLSDRTRTRAGRRRPYFLLGAVPFAASFALLWVDFGPAPQLTLFAVYAGLYVLHTTFGTVLTVPYLALLPEIVRGYHERNALYAYRSALALAATLIAGAGFRPLASAFGGGTTGFAAAATVLALWMLWPWLAIYAATREPPPARPEAATGFVTALRTLATHPSYRRLTGLYLGSRIAIDVTGMMLVFYFTYWIGRPRDFELTFLLLLVVAAAALPLWLRLARRIDKHVVFMAGAGCWGMVQALLFLVTPAVPRGLVIGCMLVAALGYGVVEMMPWSMLADVVDEDELRCGERREGLYAGVLGFLRKLAGAAAVWVASVALDLAGFVAGAPQGDLALWAIRGLTALAPACFLGLAVWCARGYALDRGRHAEIVETLARR